MKKEREKAAISRTDDYNSSSAKALQQQPEAEPSLPERISAHFEDDESMPVRVDVLLSSYIILRFNLCAWNTALCQKLLKIIYIKVSRESTFYHTS